jgi:hypothetical protein
MSHLPETQVSKPSNKHAIFLGALNVVLSVLACVYLLLFRQWIIQDIEILGQSFFPSSYMITIIVISIIVLMLIGLFLIVKFRCRKTILNIICLAILGFFAMLYNMMLFRFIVLLRLYM